MKFFLAGVILAVIFLNSCKTKEGLPVLKASADSLAVGTVFLHDSARIVYTISNTGKAPLRIKTIGTSCGCSEAIVKDSLIEPGRQTELEVIFMAQDAGNFTKYVVIETNAQPVYNTLSFYGKVIKKE